MVSEAFPIFDGAGNAMFFIGSDGQLFRSRDGRRVRQNELPYPLYQRRGQHVLLSYYQIDGGTIFRHLVIKSEDDEIRRQLFKAMGGNQWCDIYEQISSPEIEEFEGC